MNLDDEPQSAVPALRISRCNRAPVRGDGQYVLYWMIAARRAHHNFALDRALDWAEHLGRPLLVLEALRAGYRWASDRLHRFALDGMADNAKAFERGPIGYYPRVESNAGADAGLLEALAEHACLIVTDEYPCFFLPRLVSAAALRVGVALEQVDGNGLMPLRAPGRVFTTAFSLRAWQRKQLRPHLAQAPRADPLARRKLSPFGRVPAAIGARWPVASPALLEAGSARALAQLPIDHSVAIAPLTGGSAAGAQRLKRFLGRELAHYPERRNHPDADAGSSLSPYLHFGHVGAHQTLAALAAHEDWSPQRKPRPVAAGEPFWGTTPAAEAFLDQLVTWRELGFNFCHHRDDYAQYASLPDWSRRTLALHASDPRPERYTLAELEQAATADPVWNAAQRQLLREGRLHNYLRMLWGKKILEWSETPEQALEHMIVLNDKYALDGRDPNSYS
ncbi:MAG TPA: deoxyribodipyrimidine photolyase, partial [Polyangiales bacterium]|nr:deoxyribodipyrimidine photolyase [Polyangiales bacterium]